jgi:putative membrane protein
MHHMMMHGHEMQGWWTAAWPVFAVWILLWLSFWGLLIAGLILAVRWLWQETSHRRRPVPAEILKERYARGELSRQEFEAMRQELERS